MDVTFVSSRYKVIGPYIFDLGGVEVQISSCFFYWHFYWHLTRLSMGELDSPFFIFRFKLKYRCDEEKSILLCIDSKWYDYLNTRF